jgi:beta-phosphoglucomutase
VVVPRLIHGREVRVNRDFSYSQYSAPVAVAAVIFDFNGTLSDDEPVLCEIFMRLFAEHGKPMSAQEYFDRLVGLSDPEIVRAWLGEGHPEVQAVIDERVERYRAAAADGSTVHEHVREAVHYAAERVPLAICSGAARAEIEPVVEAAGLAPCFRAIVSSDDVVHGKPDPEGYLNALALLGADPAEALVFEDTEAGVASARKAGVGRVLAVRATLDPHRLARADELVDRIDLDVMRRVLS